MAIAVGDVVLFRLPSDKVRPAMVLETDDGQGRATLRVHLTRRDAHELVRLHNNRAPAVDSGGQELVPQLEGTELVIVAHPSDWSERPR